MKEGRIQGGTAQVVGSSDRVNGGATSEEIGLAT